MTRPISTGALCLAICAAIPLTAALAFFLAGAVVFPIIEPYYGARILTTLGLMALIYGIECIAGWGVIETCGFVSGNCTTHNLYPYAINIWLALALVCGVALVAWVLRTRK